MAAVSKTSKKRKMGLLDSPQTSFDRFPNSMQTERTNIQLGSFHRQTLRPKITISAMQPPRPKDLSAAEFNKSWEIQKKLVSTILSNQAQKGINYMTAARLSESLCRFGKSEALYTVLVKEIQQHVQRIKVNILNLNDDLLITLKDSWETYGLHLTVIKNVFMELDHSFILPKTKFSSIIHLGKQLFSDIIMNTEGFCDKVVNEILKLIQLNRDGIEVDRSLIQSNLCIMIELSFYAQNFEPKFLTTSLEYYKQESSRLISTLSIPEYIQQVFNRREEELNDSVLTQLDSRTKRQLDTILIQQFIYSKLETILSEGFAEMMDQQLTKPLKILYDFLCHSTTHIDMLRAAFSQYIKSTGANLIRHPKNDNTMISSVLKFKKKLDRIMKECFQQNSLFANVLKENCEYVLNTRGNKPAELLAKFFDSKLKVSNKKRTEENDLVVLDKALVLFRFLQTKDAFETYYKRFLAKRLLLNKSASRSMESHVLEKLRIECGYEFTKNLDNMFNDMETSDNLDIDFKKYKKDTPRMPIHVKVISQVTWPSYSSIQMCLSDKMKASQKLYEEFYMSRFNGRKLIWQDSLSSSTLIGNFPKGSIDISCNLAQSLVLLLFNDEDTLSFSNIQQATGLATKDLIGVLNSLSSTPYKLITNKSENTITQNDRLYLNVDFETPANKIKLPPVLVDQTTEEQRDIEEKVQINRKYQSEAAIVRIMKSKRKLHHNDLINELFKELNYSIEANDIKNRIESLIERDFIRRHKSDKSLYIYQS